LRQYRKYVNICIYLFGIDESMSQNKLKIENEKLVRRCFIKWT